MYQYKPDRIHVHITDRAGLPERISIVRLI